MSIPADFPFENRFLELRDFTLPSGARLPTLRIHYVEQGHGTPILFLHGNPTSSYLWRNILPAAARHGRAVAIDLMGHGLSDKPPVAYTFEDHFTVVRAVIDALSLHDGYVVAHDWGGPLAFRYALWEPERVRGVAAMETFAWPIPWRSVPLAGRVLFSLFRLPGPGTVLIQHLNIFVKLLLPWGVLDRAAFSEEARTRYRAMYPTPASRASIRQWPRWVPFDRWTPTWGLAREMERRLRGFSRPLLWLVAEPGAVTRPDRVAWLRREVPAAEIRPIGPGLHFVQEDNPFKIAHELDKWLAQVGT